MQTKLCGASKTKNEKLLESSRLAEVEGLPEEEQLHEEVHPLEVGNRIEDHKLLADQYLEVAVEEGLDREETVLREAGAKTVKEEGIRRCGFISLDY